MLSTAFNLVGDYYEYHKLRYDLYRALNKLWRQRKRKKTTADELDEAYNVFKASIERATVRFGPERVPMLANLTGFLVDGVVDWSYSGKDDLDQEAYERFLDFWLKALEVFDKFKTAETRKTEMMKRVKEFSEALVAEDLKRRKSRPRKMEFTEKMLESLMARYCPPAAPGEPARKKPGTR